MAATETRRWSLRRKLLLALAVLLGLVHGFLAYLGHAAVALPSLLLSLAIVLVLLTPPLRRLQAVTRVLPLLAGQRFEAAREELAGLRRSRGVADEIDALLDATAALADDLERQVGQEAAAVAKADFLATMSHEIRTPMNGILGLLELHQRTTLTPEQQEQVRVIRDSATTLLTVLDDIRDFSRLQAGQIEIDQAPVPLRDLAEGALRAFATTALDKGVRLLMFVDPVLPVTVLGDAVRLRQILFNLCANAIKFTPSGRIVLRVSSARAGGAPPIVRFAVSDTGIGVPAEVQQRLFKPFQQADASMTRRFGGSGLGLAICKALVERMGGDIGFTSEPGAGSEFWFDAVLPVAPGSHPPAWPADVLRDVDVALLVEDELERGFLQRYLESAGVAFADGHDAGAARYVVEDDPTGKELRVADALHPGVMRRLDRPVCGLTLLRAVAELAGRAARLPAAALPPLRQALAASPPDLAEAERSGRLVLVVEDHATNRRVIGAQLNALGYAADLASNGREALAKAGERAHALVLTDLHMPEMDGLQLAHELRARGIRGGGRRAHLPIIALTANTLRSAEHQCRAAGMDDFLLKPVSLSQLAERLARWLPDVAQVARPSVAATPTAAAGTTEPIDTAVLREILAGDEAAAAGLLKDFIRINEPLMQQLEAACRDGALPQAQSLAHKVLGSAHFAGARPLAAALGALEDAARDGRPEGMPALGEAAGRAFREVRDWVAARPASG
jgi:two-component system, sensor histidine kinase and response regulator